MRRTPHNLRPYFHVGHKVQLQSEAMPSGRRDPRDGTYATIKRIVQLPDLDVLEFETQEDWQIFLRTRSVLFWVKLDDVPELNDDSKQHEFPFRYRELRPIPPRMGKQQLAWYCQERFLKEPNEHRRDAYLRMMLYLKHGMLPGWPLSSIEEDVSVPEGYSVDLINRFISGANQIRALAQKSQEWDKANEQASIYEAQAQGCDEISKLLMPKQRVLV